MNILDCMGGWCKQRHRCRNYVAPTDRREPVERLCLQGRDVPTPRLASAALAMTRAWNNARMVERLRGRRLLAQKDRVRLLRPLCPMCSAEGRVVAGVELDHRVALVNGGSNEDENMDLLCVPHHRLKTAEDMNFAPRGCNVRGDPTDPRHPWAQTGGG
jgi:5-methylcytosine-specific restriction endonuclease McrA